MAEARAGFVAVEVAAITTAAPARLADGELGFLAFGSLPFDPRQGRANETAMNRPIVLAGRRKRKGIPIRIGVGAHRRRLRVDLRFRAVVLTGHLAGCCVYIQLGLFGSGAGTEDALGRLANNRVAALAAGRRHARSLVFMVRVTRGAARLFHLVLNHRNDGVIGNAALARAIVVQNVTEPKPALLHQTSPEPFLSGGVGKGVGSRQSSMDFSAMLDTRPAPPGPPRGWWTEGSGGPGQRPARSRRGARRRRTSRWRRAIRRASGD
jgi:hypothetical protein